MVRIKSNYGSSLFPLTLTDITATHCLTYIIDSIIVFTNSPALDIISAIFMALYTTILSDIHDFFLSDLKDTLNLQSAPG